MLPINRQTLFIFSIYFCAGAFAACSSSKDKTSDGGSEEISDGGNEEATAEEATEFVCSPLTQDCGVDKKCAWVSTDDNQGLGETECVADGNVARGGDCTQLSANQGGFDNCTAGNGCVSGKCVELCQMDPDSCTQGSFCSLYSDFFTDRSGVGACVLNCDVLLQDCDGAKGCYFMSQTGNAQCANPFLDNGNGTQGDVCTYVNGCAKGYGCVVLSEPGSTQAACTYFCDTTVQDSCASGPGSNFTCYGLHEINPDLSQGVPAAWGICLDPLVWDSTIRP